MELSELLSGFDLDNLICDFLSGEFVVITDINGQIIFVSRTMKNHLRMDEVCTMDSKVN